MTSDDPLLDTASALRLATFRLARRLRSIRAVDAVSDAQLAVLARLRTHGRHTISALAERERVTAPSMSAMIKTLEDQGYVGRIPDEDDRRRVHVEITAQGDELVVETIRRRTQTLADVLAELDLDAAQLRTLQAAAELMREAAGR